MMEILKAQKIFFKKDKTLDVNYRIEALKRLKKIIKQNESNIIKALKIDLDKEPMESYMTEINIVYSELDEHLKNLKKWNLDKNINTPLSLLPGKSFVKREPFGNVLIMSPWNYPFQLAMLPLIGAIGGGNTVILKPSSQTEKTSEILEKIISETFEKEYVTVVIGDHKIADELLEENFDLIFFTGSTSIGKKVMQKASKHLTPVVLELGGKSPVIIDKTANLKIAARRILFGKITNSGQTCVAPDYALISSSVYGEFVSYYQQAIEEFFQRDNFDFRYQQMAKIISEKALLKKKALLEESNVVLGGKVFVKEQKIQPTVVDAGTTLDYKNGGRFFEENAPRIMKEEIFAPILPIIRFDEIDEAINFVKEREKPLALYLFTEKLSIEKKVIEELSYGGGCINDTIVHLANGNFGFGGVGTSGMGSYHGRASFETFTHSKSIYKNSTKVDVKARYMPYSNKKFKVIKALMK